jgi:very-short-patch-repair endonuclease
MQMYTANNYDAHRDRYLKELNIRVIRFWNNDVLQNIEGVGQRIKEEVEKHS